jgi:hypothetical protein
VVVNNTKPVDQLILSSSLEAGGGQGTRGRGAYTISLVAAFGRGIFNSLCEVGGRPTIGYDNPHFRELSTFISQNSCFLSTLRQAREMTNLFLPFAQRHTPSSPPLHHTETFKGPVL